MEDGSADKERRRADRERHHQQRSEAGPRWCGPFRIKKHKQQEAVTDQAERRAGRESERIVAAPAVTDGLGMGPRVAAEHHQRQTDQYRQRRHETHRGGRVAPPHAEHQPGQQASGNRERRKAASGAFDEESGVEQREEEGHAPQPRGGARTRREEQQHHQAAENHGAPSPLRLERSPDAAGNDRHAEIEHAEDRVEQHRSTEPLGHQVRRRP